MADKFPALHNYEEWEKVRKADPQDIFRENVWDLVDETTVGTLLTYKRLAQEDADDRKDVDDEIEDFQRYLAFVQGYNAAMIDMDPEVK